MHYRVCPIRGTAPNRNILNCFTLQLTMLHLYRLVSISHITMKTCNIYGISGISITIIIFSRNKHRLRRLYSCTGTPGFYWDKHGIYVTIPGNTCPSGPLCILSPHCVWVTVVAWSVAGGDRVIGCSRAAGAPPAAYRGTVVSLASDLSESGRKINTKRYMCSWKYRCKCYMFNHNENTKGIYMILYKRRH